MVGVRAALFLFRHPPGRTHRARRVAGPCCHRRTVRRTGRGDGQDGRCGQRSGTAAFISDLVLQAVTGAVLGFITSFLFSVLSAAGSLTDMTSGLSACHHFRPHQRDREPGDGQHLQRDHDDTAVRHRRRPARSEGLPDLVPVHRADLQKRGPPRDDAHVRGGFLLPCGCRDSGPRARGHVPRLRATRAC